VKQCVGCGRIYETAHQRSPKCPKCLLLLVSLVAAAQRLAFPSILEEFMTNEKTVFLDVELTKKQKEEVSALMVDSERLNTMLQCCAEDGVRTTLTIDTANECYVCFLSPVSKDHAYEGYMLSARSSAALKAIAGAVYRHCVVYDRKWPTGSGKPRRPTDD